MSLSNMSRGELLFDERTDDSLRARKRRVNWIIRAIFVFLLVSTAFLVMALMGMVPLEIGDPWQKGNLVLGLILFSTMTVVSFLASLGEEHTAVFQNGIELCRFSGLHHKLEFFPFDSISRVYVNILNSSRKKTEHMVVELRDYDKRNYLLIDNRDLVDRGKFLELMSRKVPVDYESAVGYKLLKSLRTGKTS